MREEWWQAVAQHLKELYEEEGWEVGSRLARAAKAREDGYPEVAALMEEIARDEARHLSLVVRLLYPDEVERDVRTNLQAIIEADKGAAEREQRLATIARQAGREREAALLEALARDELEHVATLEATLTHLGPGSPEKEDLEMAEKKIPIVEPETKEQAGECCEPLCGPTTCEPGAEAVETQGVEAKAVEEPEKTSSGCGPSTCS